MALDNWKKQEQPTSDTDHLLCSVAGCGKRWSVRMEGSRPFCSKHAWEDKNSGSQPVPKHWTDEEQF